MGINKLEGFCKSLKRGPSVLFLGQNYLKLEYGKDLFLERIIQKYGSQDNENLNYHSIFETTAHDNIEDTLQWMQELSKKLSPPDWLKTTSKFYWNSVYTSAIDVVWPKVFRSDYREINPIFESKEIPSDPRNKLKLHSTFLFGNVSQMDDNKIPPLTKVEYYKRRNVANSLCNRIPSTVTLFGVLVIEGYDINDWLNIEDFFPILDELGENQIYIFSATENLKNNVLISELVKDGKANLIEESLESYIVKGEELGFLKLEVPSEEESFGKYIEIEKDILNVPPTIWNRIIPNATILDDSILSPVSKVSDDVLYQKFRNFIENAGSKLDFDGYKRGFAFNRIFENELYNITKNKLDSTGFRKNPIILHGQTGTGKTVALGHIAYKIRAEKKYPVLFIDRNISNVNYYDIDEFCYWAEEAGAPAILIIWDGMLDIQSYQELLDYLEISRGRKVVLIGSCYKIEIENDHSQFNNIPLTDLIEAPLELNDAEVEKFIKYLSKYDKSLSNSIERFKETIRYDNNFLVALYRLLPSSRFAIREGVHRETELSEEIIKYFSKSNLQNDYINTLGYSLLKAGIIGEDELFSQEEKVFDGEKINEIQELISLIVVPGRFGISVPLDLLVKALNKNFYSEFVEIFATTSIFKYEEDAVGNISVVARHPLEAKLISQARSGGPRGEIAFATTLLENIDSQFNQYLENPEVKFGIDLVKAFGPNGPERYRYSDYYLNLVKSLKLIREERGVNNSYLKLHEASLIREYVKAKKPLNTEQLLDEAAKLLKNTLDEETKDGDRKNRLIVKNLLVELSAILGTKAVHIFKNQNSKENVLALYKEAKKYLFSALEYETRDEYALDTLGWITKDILDAFEPEERAEALANALSRLESATSDSLMPSTKILARRYEILQLIESTEISEKVFEALEKSGSSAGYFLKAAIIVRKIDINKKLDEDETILFEKSVKYLIENYEKIKTDERCLNFLLNSWWRWKTGIPIFYGERKAVAFLEEDWTFCYKLLNDIKNLGIFEVKPSLVYLYGVVCFHLGDYHNAFLSFSDLNRIYTKGPRVIKKYLVSEPNGEPKKYYDGKVDWVNDNKGEIYVEEIRKKISFVPRDFNRPDIKKNESINEFHIAFNFRSIIADPVKYYKMTEE